MSRIKQLGTAKNMTHNLVNISFEPLLIKTSHSSLYLGANFHLYFFYNNQKNEVQKIDMLRFQKLQRPYQRGCQGGLPVVWLTKQQPCTCITCFVHFYIVTAPFPRENSSKFQVLWRSQTRDELAAFLFSIWKRTIKNSTPENSFMFSEAWAVAISHTFTKKRFIYQSLTPL